MCEYCGGFKRLLAGLAKDLDKICEGGCLRRLCSHTFQFQAAYLLESLFGEPFFLGRSLGLELAKLFARICGCQKPWQTAADRQRLVLLCLASLPS